MKMTQKKTLAAFMISIMAVGCASNDMTKLEVEKAKHDATVDRVDETLSNIPSWYMKPPKSNGEGFFAAGTGMSSDLDMAVTKAKINAEFELAKKYRQIVSGSERAYTSETTNSATKESKVVSLTEKTIDKLVANAQLSDYDVTDTEIIREGTQYRVYLLSFMPYDSNNDGNDDLFRDVRAASDIAFKDLERRVDKATNGNAVE
ncbi:hypothetical protein OH460_23220 [Vibrio sp. Makdt]|uniref:hypothetical protein n=1 Tax=Vibrio sp. Makdt TaxID=2998828 RepID=UPI0022CD2509|nr:hypothetical protein [Vibrio sp. Makdt]MDA0155231.1 hypothetical protein [Vibrio sp. Makdt]